MNCTIDCSFEPATGNKVKVPVFQFDSLLTDKRKGANAHMETHTRLVVVQGYRRNNMFLQNTLKAFLSKYERKSGNILSVFQTDVDNTASSARLSLEHYVNPVNDRLIKHVISHCLSSKQS